MSEMGLASCKQRKHDDDEGGKDLVEAIVCDENDFPDNSMKEVTLEGDFKVLLVKQGGAISAIGTKCSHYGAPLVKGALGDGRVRCPWHGACFNIKTGDIEDFPGLDSVPSYEVQIEGGQVKVKGRRSELIANRKVHKGMVRRDPANAKTVVVVGGGAAGATCVEVLRQEGFTGRIVLVCKEPHLPYDRPKLSKAMDSQAEKLYLRTNDFYKSFDIEVMLGEEVTRVDVGVKSVILSKGQEVKYDALFLATGSHPREMRTMPGGTLKNIVPLRSIEDANRIAAEARGKRIVMLGNSFIGMEVAAYLADKVTSLAVVGLSDVPFEPVLGRDLGTRLGKLYSDAGVILHGGKALASFTPSQEDPEKLGSVVLGDGTDLPADMCILGLGAIASTQFLENSGIELSPRGGFVNVDKRLRTSAGSVWAGGDIAATPLKINSEEMNGVAIGHWQVAHYHGKIAASNIAAELCDNPAKARDLRTVPFYWTVMFGKSLRYAGYGVGFEEVKIVGDLEALKFAAYFLKDNNVIALATLNSDPLAAKFAEHLAADKPAITKQQLELDPEGWLH